MRPTTLRTSALALLAFASTAAAQARNLSDPGRMYRAWNMPKVATRGASTYNLYFTPTFGWNDNSNTLGGQLRYASDNLISNMPVAISGAVMNFHTNRSGGLPNDNQLGEQVIGEIGLWSNPSAMFSLTGQFMHADIVKSWEMVPEFDWMLPKNDMFSGAIGALAYLDRTDISGISTPAKSRIFAAVGYLNRGTWSFVPEYDFSQDEIGEDTYSLKVTKSFTNMARDPRLFVGVSRHSNYMAGARWTMK